MDSNQTAKDIWLQHEPNIRKHLEGIINEFNEIGIQKKSNRQQIGFLMLVISTLIRSIKCGKETKLKILNDLKQTI